MIPFSLKYSFFPLYQSVEIKNWSNHSNYSLFIKNSDIFGHNWWAAWKKIHNRTVVSLDLSIQITFYKKITIFHICRQSINKFYAKHNTWCEGVDWHASLVWIHWTRAHVPSSKQSTCLPIHSQQSIKYLLAPACYARLNCKQIFSYFKLTRRCRMKR